MNQSKEILPLNTFKGRIFAAQNFRRLDVNRPLKITIKCWHNASAQVRNTEMTYKITSIMETLPEDQFERT